MGHADIATTHGIDADVTKEFKKEQFAGLENFFQGHRTLAAAENA